MVKRILLCLLILLSYPVYSQPSSGPSNESMICLTAGEWDELEAQIKMELETAVTEAVNEAVKPYVIQVNLMERDILWWKITSGVLATAAIIGWILYGLR